MRILTVLSLLLFSCSLRATDAIPSVQKGKTISIQLFEIRRQRAGDPSGAPDGIVFRFWTMRAAGNHDQFAIKETRDAMIAGKSYTESTLAALGKNFEPGTVVDSAPKFFTQHPEVKPPAGVTFDRGAGVVSISLHGAALKTGQDVVATVHVSYGTQVEDFDVAFTVPER